MAFVAGDDVDLITLDKALERRFRFQVNDTATQLSGHLLNIIFVEIEFFRDLLVRQVEPHQIQTQYPLAQRLMVMCENRIGQIVEVPAAGFAMIALPFALALMHSALLDLVGFAPDTSDAFRPAELAHTFITLRVVYQVVESEHIDSMRRPVFLIKELVTGGPDSSSQNQLLSLWLLGFAVKVIHILRQLRQVYYKNCTISEAALSYQPLHFSFINNLDFFSPALI